MTRRLHDLLEASAAREPERVAVEDPERGIAATYGELERLAESVRRALDRAGVGEGDRVGICAPKSIGTVAGILGTLRAGAAYVPVDSTAPASRNATILDDCSVSAVVADPRLVEGLRGELPGRALPVLDALEDLRRSGVELVLLGGTAAERSTGGAPRAGDGPPAGDLAYVLYTSGSTGRPKGVVHTHASALSFVDWCSEALAPEAGDRFSSHAPFHFDLSILDLYVPLRHGGTIVLVGEDLGKQPQRLAPLIAERRLSVWYSTPAILRLLVEFGNLERHDVSALRMVLFAGEVFPVKHLRALQDLWPRPRYLNLYGPTETNVCTYYEVPGRLPDERTEPLPIGKTCSNDRSRVVDEEDRDVEPGTEGELVVAGGSVMRGYWNLPERTARAFLEDAAGARWYRTGDLVRQDPEGDFLFAGRRDRMVKRRGYRIELGEIESALYRHPAIGEAGVLAESDEQRGVVITAFLSCPNGTRPSLIELKRFCAQNLPTYMVPDRFEIRESLPRTSTDKIDYQRLRTSA